MGNETKVTLDVQGRATKSKFASVNGLVRYWAILRDASGREVYRSQRRESHYGACMDAVSIARRRGWEVMP